ncbi:T9SS type A sorting domain-containing protein [Flavobacterium sp.]|uniref:T9SS type A sorting domain-containing protein n=1 Tax=Flavobacterium sp. TaxID=239 RepID=UPI0022BD3CAE|nr:T9SS type A sorting domain-containing protein [Flavobacterium sp.]MCZ8169129.1 T9SS type A sorting domain-containing protein [Flavobacterium sp.]
MLFFCYTSFSQTVVWQNRLGGDLRNTSYKSLLLTDGNVLIGGRSNSNAFADKTENSKGDFDYWLIKTDGNGTTVWDKTLGGSGLEIFYDCIATNDNGALVVGYSNSPISGDKTENLIGGAYDFWVVRLDENGSIIWQNTLGGNGNDTPVSACLTADGGFLIVGYSDSDSSGDKTENSRGFQDFWVVKLDANGAVLWDKTIGGTGNDIASKIIPLSDGNFLITGYSTSSISGEKNENSRGGHDFWILKINPFGNIIWQKTLGGNGFDAPYCAVEFNADAYVIGGESNSNQSGDKTENTRGNSDYWLVVVNNQGNLIQQKTIGGSQLDNLLAMTKTIDNHLVLCGFSNSPISGEKTISNVGLGTDSWLLKVNSSFSSVWQKTYGGNFDEGINSIFEFPNGDLCVSGSTGSPLSGSLTEGPVGETDYWILRLTASLDTPSYPDKAIFSIAPNPTNSNVSLQWQSDGNAITIGLYSPLGQLLSHQIDASGLVAIELPEANGVYILKINTVNDQYYTFKILKM